MRILVIGETCFDIYRYGSCKRINPEAPTPVMLFQEETRTLGMAGNVYNNIKSLRPEWNTQIVSQVNEIQKRRYVDRNSNYILLREDINDKADVLREIPKLENYDAVVISDYHKGFLLESILEGILNLCYELGIPTFLDTKKILGEWSKYCYCIKINKKEFELQPKNYKDYCQNIVVTLGKEGALLRGSEGTFHDDVPDIEIKDVCGAGDSFLAGLVVNYSETKSLTSAVKFANKVATVAVSKRGTVAVKKEEV